MKKLMSLFLAALCLLGCAAPVFAGEGLGNFKKTAEYAEGLFSDVGGADWYAESVAAVYELGLMKGNGDGVFNAGGNVTIAESLTMAARLHRIYHGGEDDFTPSAPWYQVYADYCVENGVVPGLPENLSASATRAEFAAILAGALPETALRPINDIADDAVPDVKQHTPYAQEIYRLYRAGILRGNDEFGRFTPDTPIQRSAVAAIVSRMAYRSLRLKFELIPTRYPDLTKQSEPAGDDYFADAAMLGNSLVDGMNLYSGLKMSYYGKTAATVYSNRLSELLQKRYGKVYIGFGINELGGNWDDVFTKYRSIVDRIREAMPEAELYLMAVTPVTKTVSDRGTFTMKRIGEFNARLRALAEESECWYLDACTPLCDESGYLPAAYAGWDGSPHLATAGYVAWADVIRSYYA